MNCLKGVKVHDFKNSYQILECHFVYYITNNFIASSYGGKQISFVFFSELEKLFLIFSSETELVPFKILIEVVVTV